MKYNRHVFPLYVCICIVIVFHKQQANHRQRLDRHLDEVYIKSHLCQARARLSAMIYLLYVLLQTDTLSQPPLNQEGHLP